jgi:hypothetical protein
MTIRRTDRDAATDLAQATTRAERITNRAGITMVRAAAGRHARTARAGIPGAGSASGPVRRGA